MPWGGGGGRGRVGMSTLVIGIAVGRWTGLTPTALLVKMIHEVCKSAVLRSAVLLHDVLQGVVDDHGAQVALYLGHGPAKHSP